MSHGPATLLGNIMGDLAPGDVLYMLNSQEPLVVMFTTEDVVILNSAEIWNKYRVVRFCRQWEREFPINWKGFVQATDYKLNFSPFELDAYEENLIVIIFSPDRSRAKVAKLIGKDMRRKRWLLDDKTTISFSAGKRIMPTGLKYSDDEEVISNEE
jgi:hypothetical protein